MAFDYPKKIRFKCNKCGICCGDTPEKARHVLLLNEEASNIAFATGKPISDFALEIEGKLPYCYEMKKTAENGKCVFLKRNRCSIYSLRPLICRFYPFGLTLNENAQSVFYFTRECPGIEKGRLMQEEDFRKLLAQTTKHAKMKHGNETDP